MPNDIQSSLYAVDYGLLWEDCEGITMRQNSYGIGDDVVCQLKVHKFCIFELPSIFSYYDTIVCQYIVKTIHLFNFVLVKFLRSWYKSIYWVNYLSLKRI